MVCEHGIRQVLCGWCRLFFDESAKNFFAVGDRVRRSAYGKFKNVPSTRLGSKKSITGVVTGYSKQAGYLIVVQRDDIAMPVVYSMAFWEKYEGHGIASRKHETTEPVKPSTFVWRGRTRLSDIPGG